MIFYQEMSTKEKVMEEDAYNYIMEKASEDNELHKELKDIIVEWFFSGNWIKVEDENG